MALLTITIAQIVARKHWVRYSRGAGQSYSHTSLCCRLCLRSPAVTRGRAFPSSCLEPLPRSRALPSLPWPFCCAPCPWATGSGSPRRLWHDPFPFQQLCGAGKAFPGLEAPGDARSWQSTGCAWAPERRQLPRLPRAARALPGPGGIPSLRGILCCREALQRGRALHWGLQQPGLVRGAPAPP